MPIKYKPRSNPPSVLDQIIIELGLNARSLSKRLGITYRMLRYPLKGNLPLQVDVAKRLQLECAKHGIAITLDEIYQEVPVWYSEKEIEKQNSASRASQAESIKYKRNLTSSPP